jgi:CheY-like chemotaxis protein
MDIEMPIMNGLDATLAIRKLGFNEPIIALSANAFPDDMKRALNCGMNDFLPKPSEINALKVMLHTWLHTIKL